MNCQVSRAYLSAYLDNELDVASIFHIQQHLEYCSDCRLAQEQQLALRSALRDPSLYATLTPEFAIRIHTVIRRAARQEGRSRRSVSFWPLSFEPSRWVPVAAVVAIVATIGGLLTLNDLRSSRQQLIANAVLTGHIRSL